jgi:serine/threonine protein phosphatase PrpC
MSSSAPDHTEKSFTSRAPDYEPLVARSYGMTDRGRERLENEDQFLIAALARALWVQQSSLHEAAVQYADAEGQLFVVADGMGGHVGGAQASALALSAIEDFLLHSIRWLFALGGTASADFDVLGEFKAALRRADAKVCEEASAHPELKGMGTTLTMAYSHGAELFVAHVGDSRCYLFRRGQLHQLTQDHTVVGELVRSGLVPPERAADHQLRHVITNVVGGPKPGVHAEVHKVRLEPEDMLLLCTDGLTEMVADDEITRVLTEERSLRTGANRLVALANERGGVDNITVVVARYDRPAEKPKG